MKNYELSKELKDAGFPQTPIFNLTEPHGHYIEGNVEQDEGGIVTTNSAYAPILSELIEACGDEFFMLRHFTPYGADQFWQADAAGDGIAEGSSPEEAVARLWLAKV